MRGHQDLIAMRRRGYVPHVVFIDIGQDRLWDGWVERTPWSAHLCVGESEQPSRADLRCVVGLTVSVHGEDAARVHALRDACIEARAARVIATVSRCTHDVLKYERFECSEVTDTAGVMTWPN